LLAKKKVCLGCKTRIIPRRKHREIHPEVVVEVLLHQEEVEEVLHSQVEAVLNQELSACQVQHLDYQPSVPQRLMRRLAAGSTGNTWRHNSDILRMPHTDLGRHSIAHIERHSPLLLPQQLLDLPFEQLVIVRLHSYLGIVYYTLHDCLLYRCDLHILHRSLGFEHLVP
jgi:hypothetical protein